MDSAILGKYASVCDMPYTTQKITYHRGYGNLVVHEVKGDNTVSTSITKTNRIEPLNVKFGAPLEHQIQTETSIAWADKQFF